MRHGQIIKPLPDLLDKIISFEDGSLDNEGVCELFQNLLDTGMIWSLQGTYQRNMQYLLNEGYIRPQKKLNA